MSEVGPVIPYFRITRVDCTSLGRCRSKGRRRLLPRDRIIILVMRPALSTRRRSRCRRTSDLHVSSLRRTPMVDDRLSMSRITVNVLRRATILVAVVRVSVRLSRQQHVCLPSQGRKVSFCQLSGRRNGRPPRPFKEGVAR